MAFQDNGRGAEAVAEVSLSESQGEAMRRLLYDDMREAAESMSKAALAALDEDAQRPEVHQLYDRMSMMASILDAIGWTRRGYQDALAARVAEPNG
jgi:hypothetical protein